MPWQSLGILTLNQQWVHTLPVVGELFRVTHYPVDNRNERYLKGVVCQGFFDDGLNIFDRKLLTWREEKEVFLFLFPVGLDEHFLAFKRLDENSIVWNIKAEVFLSSTAQEDFTNYINLRFGDIMPLYDTFLSSVPTKKEQIEANVSQNPIETQVTVLAQVSINRRQLSIYNPSNSFVEIGCAITESVNGSEPQLQSVLAIISPGKIYELPTSGDGSCYAGYIYAKADVADSTKFLQVTEFKAV